MICETTMAESKASSSKGAHTISYEAYAKLILHACKTPSLAVNGILIGRVTGSSVEVVDSIPLFHTSTLAPMLEAALTMVRPSAARGCVCFNVYCNVFVVFVAPPPLPPTAP